MAKKKEKAARSSDAVSLDDVMRIMNDRYGEGTVITGLMTKKDPPRLPTGVFPIDFCTGGGIPLWHTICLWGPESGAKSAIAQKAMATAAAICWKCFRPLSFCSCSQAPLKMRSAWADVEGTHDRDWAECIGAKPESYFRIIAEYGEQYIDVAEAALRADECGLLVFDSLAALTPEAEFDAMSEDQFMGLQARMIGRALRKFKTRLIREGKRGHPCTIIFTNQMRKKIGQMFGDPETMSGGHAMMHEFSIVLRCGKKKLSKETDSRYIDATRSKDMASRHTFSIRKEKVMTMAGTGEFVIVKENMSDQGLTKGMIDDYQTVLTYAKEYGVIEKKGDKYFLFDGKKASKQDDFKRFWKKFPDQYLLTQLEIINRAKERLKNADQTVPDVQGDDHAADE